MPVVHVTRDFPPSSTGGLSTAVGGLVAARRARGDHDVVVSFDGWRVRGGTGQTAPRWELIDGTRILRMRTGANLDAGREALRRLDASVVVVHCPWFWAWSSTWTKGAMRVAVAHVMHQVQARLRQVEEPPASALVEARAWEEADRVIVLSRSAHRALPASVMDKARMAGLGVTAPEDTVEPTHAETVPMVLHVGRWSDSKGLNALLERWPRVRDRVPGATLVMAGGLPENPKGERRWWRRCAADVPGVLAPGWLSAAELAGWRDQSHVGISVSPWETFGLAVAEHFAHGLPVLSTPTGVAEETLPAWPLGHLLPLESSEAWEQALIGALSHRADRVTWRKRAGLWLAQEGGWPARLPAWDAALAPT